MRTFLSLLLFLIGETLIIIGFRHFGSGLPEDIRILDIVVTSVIFSLFFLDVIFPWSNLRNKSQSAIGAIGIRWLFVFIYTFLAIGAMVCFIVWKPLAFESQLIIHGILFFLLLFGLFMAYSSASKVKEVYNREAGLRNRKEELLKAAKAIHLKLVLKTGIMPETVMKFNMLQDDLQYLSSCDNSYAFELEDRISEELNEIQRSLAVNPVDNGAIDEQIEICEKLLHERKQLYTIHK